MRLPDLQSWTGKIVAINTVIFIALCVVSGAVMVPDIPSLLRFGASEPVSVAQGEYWRLVAPIFVHAGIIHFAFNTMMLNVIGKQIEGMIGGRRFIVIYLLSGISGVVASLYYSMAVSVGASGAIFGLLGCGFYIERRINKAVYQRTGQKAQNSAYAMTVLLNLAIGFWIPVIDNAAHIGGLVAGFLSTAAMFHLRDNQLMRSNHLLGIVSVVALVVSLAFGTREVTSSQRTAIRLVNASNATNNTIEKIRYISSALILEPSRGDLFFERAKIYLFTGNIAFVDYALADLTRGVALVPSLRSEVMKLAGELEASGLFVQASRLRSHEF